MINLHEGGITIIIMLCKVKEWKNGFAVEDLRPVWDPSILRNSVAKSGIICNFEISLFISGTSCQSSGHIKYIIKPTERNSWTSIQWSYQDTKPQNLLLIFMSYLLLSKGKPVSFVNTHFIGHFLFPVFLVTDKHFHIWRIHFYSLSAILSWLLVAYCKNYAV